jgi:hypothetical protein
MATPTRFTDSKGDVWDVALSVGMLERLQADADFALDALIESPDAMSAKLFKSPRVFAQALWVLCEEQAAARGLDGRGFGMRLDRETLDRATEAFFEAAVLFYPRSSAGKAIKGRLPELFRRMDEETARQANEYMDRVLAGVSSATAGDSPASPGLTPGR